MFLKRIHKWETKWRKQLIQFNWLVVFISAIVSLLPIFINIDLQRKGYPSGYFADILNNSSFIAPVDSATVMSIITDDDLVRGSHLDTTMIVGPFLGMCLPAAVDLLVDVFVAFTNPPTTSGDEKNNQLEIVRLSMLERFVFIVGIICNSLYFLFPLDWNIMALYAGRQVLTNLNTLLSTAPIIMFLERTTNVFSPILTTVIIVLLALGGTMSCFLFNLPFDTVPYGMIYVDYQYILLAVFVLILSVCSWSFVQFVLQQRYTIKLDGMKKQQQLDPFNDFSVNRVPAFHVVALCVICVVNMCFYTSPTKISKHIYNLLWTLILLASTLVFVIEMRVRQNEVMHGLHSLKSKRSFVRFISHEVRTPLCTASMGLELLNLAVSQKLPPITTPTGHQTTENGAGNVFNVFTQEDHEALILVQESIRVAVNVFDNLLQFDALDREDDAMDLKYQSINAASMLNKIIAPMKLEARSKEVTLVGNLIDCRQLSPTASEAFVEVDERRIAQCIRSLVSGAISLTPKNGTVFINLRVPGLVENMSSSGFVLESTSGGGASSRRKSSGFGIVPLSYGNDDEATNDASISAAVRPVNNQYGGRRFSLLEPSNSGNKLNRRASNSSSTTTPKPLSRPSGLTLFSCAKQLQWARTLRESMMFTPSKYIILDIQYSGPGFDMTDVKQVNTEMFSFKPNELHGGGGSGGGTGSGLGLSLAKSIAEAHGGHLHIKSEGSELGSTIVFEIPLSSGDSEKQNDDDTPINRSSQQQQVIATTIATPPHLPGPVKSLSTDSRNQVPLPSTSDNNRELVNNKSGGGGRQVVLDHFGDKMMLPFIQEQEKEEKKGLLANVSIKEPDDSLRFGSDKQPIESDSSVGNMFSESQRRDESDKSVVAFAGYHVLVVEDSSAARKMLVRSLKALQCTTEEAVDGSEAVNMVRISLLDDRHYYGKKVRRPFDLILCDSVMPNMAGPEAVKQIREMGYTCPILGVTGNTLPEQIADFLAHGANDIIAKPVKLNVLKDCITKHHHMASLPAVGSNTDDHTLTMNHLKSEQSIES